ncbi:hypothetical protein QUF72_22445 [Desulfobacterales bacterium HSG2]|nr:hypothetical protein [Desulfobacterales bacterium HSG2]
MGLGNPPRSVHPPRSVLIAKSEPPDLAIREGAELPDLAIRQEREGAGKGTELPDLAIRQEQGMGAYSQSSDTGGSI